MSILEAIVLGVVQGLTEFLPISSTAHLRIVPAFLGWDDPGTAFTAVVQLGTMSAVVIYFREDLLRIARAWLRSLRAPSPTGARALTARPPRGHSLRAPPPDDRDARMGWYIILATIPIGIFGLLFKDEIESGARDLYLIGTALIALALVLLAAEEVGSKRRGMDDVGARDGLFVGLAQALALIPGVSRSGATISAGLFLGLDRPSAARLSFLLSVPAVVLSGLYELKDALGESTGASAFALAVAVSTAFVSGYASIAVLLRYLVTHTFRVFVGYRVLLGSLVIALTAAGAIT